MIKRKWQSQKEAREEAVDPMLVPQNPKVFYLLPYT
jgi:hypothetical protein